MQRNAFFALTLSFVLLGFLAEAKDTFRPQNTDQKEQIRTGLWERLTADRSYFEINNGQLAPEQLYRYGNHQANVDFYTNKVVFSMRELVEAPDLKTPDSKPVFDMVVWQIEFDPSNSMETMHAQERTIKGVNHFDRNGQHIAHQATDRVTYRNIFEKIDLQFYINIEGELKYDFILHPGALLSSIQLDYVGVEGLEVTSKGRLAYQTDWGRVEEDVPFSYTKKDGKEVALSYQVSGNTLSFEGLEGPVTEQTILDPIYVDWSTFFYGEGNGSGWAWTWVLDLDIDDSDNIYVTGMTSDRFVTGVNAFDTTINGWYDAFVCKMAPDGDSLVWFSYIGGNSYEYSFTLTVNSAQQPVIAGFSWSSNFPTTPGAYDRTSGAINRYKGFITKFTKNGDSLVFSTFLGGSENDLIHSLALDDAGYLYITGETKSSNFPTTANCYQSTYGGGSGSWWTGGDAFLTKMNPSGSGLVYSTFIGGANNDVAYSIALSPSDEIYLVGKTESGNFPVTPGSSIFNYNVSGTNDGFIMKFRTDGKTLVYSKMMGGSGEDWFEGVFVNDQDEAYVAGISKSSNFYTTSNAYQKNSSGGADIVLVKFNALGQNVVYSTYIGGSGDEMYWSGWIYNSNVSISANVREEPIICGISRSNDFPVTSDALMTNNPSNTGGGWWNTSAVIVKLDYQGRNLLYGTYFGGSSYEIPGANKLRRISCYTNILYGGITASADYPTTSGVYKPSKTSSGTSWFWTGFISKFRDTLYTDLIQLSLEDTITECDDVFEIMDAKNQGADILWSTGESSRFVIIQDTGQYWVRATYGCDTVRDTIHFVLEYSPVIPVLPDDSTYCNQFPSIDLDAGNDSMLATYVWSTGDSTKDVTVDQQGTYWVRIETPNCGEKTDTVHYVLETTPVALLPEDSTFCDSVRLLLDVGLSDNGESYVWNTGDSISSVLALSPDLYKVWIQNHCGVDSAEVQLDLRYTPMVSLPPDSVYCDQVDFSYTYPGIANNDEQYTWIDLGTQVTLGLTDSIALTQPGRYALLVQNGCGIITDSIELSLVLTPEADLGADKIFCDAVLEEIIAGRRDNEETYVWQDGSADTSYWVQSEGLYWVQIDNRCGTSRDTVEYILRNTPVAVITDGSSVFPDSIFCNVVDATLDAELSFTDMDYLWNTGSTDPNIQVSDSGLYWVQISGHCGTAKDSVYLRLYHDPSVELGPERVFCGAVTPFDIEVGEENNGESYLWSSGGMGNSMNVQTDGKHWVEISNKCASVSDTLSVRISPHPVVDLGPDTSLCGNFSLILDAGIPGMDYLWEPYGETTQTIEVNEQRVYRVTVSNTDGCTGSDDFEVTGDCISHVYVPSAFSPNGDPHNPTFRPVLVNFEQYQMRIYDRWGELLFESNDPNIGWDGTYKGEDVPTGSYLYIIDLVTTEDMKGRQEKGLVHLVR